MTYIFAVNLSWKNLPPVRLTAIKPTFKPPERPQTLGTLHLEITLHKTIANSFKGPLPDFQPSPNEYYLTPVAFHPRSFNIAVEKGNFIPDSYIGRYPQGSLNPQWGLRLVFDKSPYPSQEGLANPKCSYDCSDRFNAMKTCVARELREGEKKGKKAMNDPTFTMQDLIRPVRRALGIGAEEFHMCASCTPFFGAGWGEGKGGEEARRNCPNR